MYNKYDQSVKDKLNFCNSFAANAFHRNSFEASEVNNEQTTTYIGNANSNMDENVDLRSCLEQCAANVISLDYFLMNEHNDGFPKELQINNVQIFRHYKRIKEHSGCTRSIWQQCFYIIGDGKNTESSFQRRS